MGLGGAKTGQLLGAALTGLPSWEASSLSEPLGLLQKPWEMPVMVNVGDCCFCH